MLLCRELAGRRELFGRFFYFATANQKQRTSLIGPPRRSCTLIANSQTPRPARPQQRGRNRGGGRERHRRCYTSRSRMIRFMNKTTMKMICWRFVIAAASLGVLRAHVLNICRHSCKAIRQRINSSQKRDPDFHFSRGQRHYFCFDVALLIVSRPAVENSTDTHSSVVAAPSLCKFRF